MHACIHTCIHAYMHTCIHAYMHTCIHAYMHTCIHASMHASIHACIHPSIHPSIHASMHPCIHPSIHPSMHPCMHASIHPHKKKSWADIHPLNSILVPLNQIKSINLADFLWVKFPFSKGLHWPQRRRQVIPLHSSSVRFGLDAADSMN